MRIYCRRFSKAERQHNMDNINIGDGRFQTLFLQKNFPFLQERPYFSPLLLGNGVPVECVHKIEFWDDVMGIR